MCEGVLPPPITPRVDDAAVPESSVVASYKSPKSCAFPSVEIVTYEIVLTNVGLLPPAEKPRPLCPWL